MQTPSPAPASDLDQYPHVGVSEIKKLGWRAIAKLAQSAPVVLTGHGKPEHVVMPLALFQSLQAAASSEDPLQALRRRFDERLSSVEGQKGAEALLKAMRSASPADMAQTADSPLVAG
ncbi:MAG: hypothetical protein A2580_18050 [Hydrogenophilales bacterium RIFOXYD1_FULL_62_11]|nr:MAG: hypothetical protein A2580_18050 [Hydrogenophilales bacterium RIFOXYD1_FULL_62_11]